MLQLKPSGFLKANLPVGLKFFPQSMADVPATKRQSHSATLWAVSTAIWMALLIATPISIWIAGDEVFPFMVALTVLAQSGVTLAALALGWPVNRILGAIAILLVGAWGIEALGSAIGFPFGHYDYTPALQPQLSGVPLLIPLAWFMMLVPSWAMADAILSSRREHLGHWYAPLFALLAGAAFTAWDLYLDPQMVGHGLWVWHNPNGYFGIPWVNFLGWWCTAALLTLIIRPSRLPRMPLMVIYTATWAFQAIGLGIFWGQPGPALAGLACMGVFVVWAWSKERKS